MSNRAPLLLSDFHGNWRVLRIISHLKGPDARFEGSAQWTEAEGGFNYTETGMMTLAGHPPLQAERRYFWAEDLSVFFEDGRFFHRVPADGGAVQHWCDPDQYDLVYDFDTWPQFTVSWHVRGPRKDYRAQTVYDRIDG